MTEFNYQGKRIPFSPEHTVLDALLEAGIAIPYGCRSGACQACLVQSQSGSIPTQAQLGLNPTQRQQQLVLSCQCPAQNDLKLRYFDASTQRKDGTLIDKTLLSEDVLRLRLRSSIAWRAGQYINLWADEQHSRCYSIASLASEDPFIELHVKLYPDGLLSPLLFHKVHVGDQLSLQGPLGEFCYQDESTDEAMLLLAEGTGLAPQIGIIRDALQRGHRAAIHVFYQSRSNTDTYPISQLEPVCETAGNVSWSRMPSGQELECLKTMAPLRGRRVYICGGNAFVNKMQRLSFRHGASRSAFVTERFVDFSEGLEGGSD